MARQENPKAEETRQLFMRVKKLIEISRMLGLPEGTIRRWKSTYGWEVRNGVG